LTLDVRHRRDSVRHASGAALRKLAQRIAEARQMKIVWQPVQQIVSVPCSPQLSMSLKRAVQSHQREVVTLPSGAGHDAAVMARITPAAMLFVRCQGGVSHHPDESVKLADVHTAIEVLVDFIQTLAKENS